MAEHEIMMAGTGGQGLVFVSSFLAEAAMLEGRNVVQTQSYGISQRGGFISSEVLMDSGEILFQQVSTPHMIIALNDVVGNRYDAAEAPVLYDSSLMRPREFSSWVGLPFTRAAEELKAPRAANLVALGAAATLGGFVRLESLVALARKKFAGPVADANVAALEKGAELARQHGGKV